MNEIVTTNSNNYKNNIKEEFICLLKVIIFKVFVFFFTADFMHRTKKNVT